MRLIYWISLRKSHNKAFSVVNVNWANKQKWDVKCTEIMERVRSLNYVCWNEFNLFLFLEY